MKICNFIKLQYILPKLCGRVARVSRLMAFWKISKNNPIRDLRSSLCLFQGMFFALDYSHKLFCRVYNCTILLLSTTSTATESRSPSAGLPSDSELPPEVGYPPPSPRTSISTISRCGSTSIYLTHDINHATR